MSEELLQTIPQQIGKYTYYRLGSTTLNQLRTAGIIPKKNYTNLEAKKPDGLVVYQGGIKAVVEFKQSKYLNTDEGVQKAVDQEREVARALCKVMIVTDGSRSYWINALNGERIRDASGQEVRAVFNPLLVKNIAALESLLERVDASVMRTNSIIQSARVIDPTPLATRLWQTIWVATGKTPVKCLYNVVELFIFKFLSDLKILPQDQAFARILEKARIDPEESLEFYARNTRKQILRLFPVAPDGTTIINGTIFVTERGEPNLTQATLFRKSLLHLHQYTEEFGSLTQIDKQFKTRLYASFLQPEAEALGQYFTPRRVIQSVIRMAGLDSPSFQFAGKRICDPFCGLGGFPLELLNMNEAMRVHYIPNSSGKIVLPFALHGFDKGFEQEDERTIILAKANMLIYLAELLFSHPTCTKEFARVFNDTFRLFKDNLGTFGHIIKDETEKYDYILSNPPYVTSGSGIIKDEIKRNAVTMNEYPVNAFGLEGISLEWIVKSLKGGGKAFVIIPDGVLCRIPDLKLRKYLLQECYLDAIVSLPVRTFFANFEHTYILALTKKHNPADVQHEPVFTYLASNIGERLTSVKREEIDADDLPEMERLFRIFTAAKNETKELLEKQSRRCKIQPVQRFQEEPHWLIDRWWTRDERIAAGVDEHTGAAASNEVTAALTAFYEALADYEQFVSADPLETTKRRKVALGDTSLFRMFIGKRVLKKDATSGSILVYSANPQKPMGTVETSNITDFSTHSILWGIDGNFEFNLKLPGEQFATTDHCGALQIVHPGILPEYVLYALTFRRQEESFDRAFRAALDNMSRLEIEIPILADGMFDMATQEAVANRFTIAQEKRSLLATAKRALDEIFGRYIGSGEV